MKKKLLGLLLVISMTFAFVACGEIEDEEEYVVNQDSEEDAASSVDTEAPAVETDNTVITMEDYYGVWNIDAEETEKRLTINDSLKEMYGTALGTYGSTVTIGEDKTIVWYIGAADFAEGSWEYQDGSIVATVTDNFGDESEELTKTFAIEVINDTYYLSAEIMGETHLWTKEK